MEKQRSVGVSIICITYNHAEFIRRAIEGFLKQKTSFPYEIIIHDDASTDGTREILLEYQRKYPNQIRLFLEDENQYSKIVRIMLALILEAKGKYVAISDGDDEWTYDRKLQEQYELLEQNPEISFCMHNVIRYNRQTGEKVEQMKDTESRMLNDREIILEPYGRAPTTSFFFRTEHISEIPQFCYCAPVGDDPLRLYYACRGKIYYLNKTWAVRNYMHEGSWNYKMQNISFQLDYIKKYLRFLNEFNAYSQKRFESYLLKKIYRLCSWAVDLSLREMSGVGELKEAIRKLSQETEDQFDGALEQIYNNRVSQCIDYLDTEAKEFIEKCKQEGGRLYLYGTGGEAEKFAEKLEYMNIPYEGFVVSDHHKKEENFMNHTIWEISVLDREKSYLWLTLNPKNTGQVLPYVEELGFRNILYAKKSERSE